MLVLENGFLFDVLCILNIENDMMKNWKMSYAAGIVDGEGSIKIDKSKGRHGEINLQYSLSLSVTNTNPKMIRFLKDTFGGCIYLDRKGEGNHRTTYRWAVSCLNAECILKKIYKYLVCKKDEADVAFIFRNTYKDKHKPDRLGTSKEILEMRENCYNELKYLHNKIYTIL